MKKPSTIAVAVTAKAGAPCVCARLRRASRAVTQLYDDALAPAGLRVTQFSLLRMLEQHGAMTISTLASTLLLDRTAVSRNLDPLIARKLVSVVPGSDARTREVTITASGRQATEAAAPHWTKAQVDVASRIGTQRLTALVGLLEYLETLHPSPPHPSAQKVSV